MDENPKPGKGQTFDPDEPQTKTEPQAQETKGTVTLTQEQFDALIKRLDGRSVTDMAPAVSFATGLRTNSLGQVVGTVTKYSIDPEDYPSPIEDLLDDFERDPKMRRFNLRDNYYISWDMTAKPYQTKDGLSVQEPTFHVTIHENEYDEEGNETGRFIIRKTLHFNEDEELINIFASENGIEITPETLKDLYKKVRYQRVRDWMVNEYFFPPRIYSQNDDATELAVDGHVVKVVTKSNVKGWDKTPVIKDEELS